MNRKSSSFKIPHLLIVFPCSAVLLFGSTDAPQPKWVALNTVGFEIAVSQDHNDGRTAHTQFIPLEFSVNHSGPLIVFLNGLGQNGNDGLPLKNNFGPQVWEMRRDFPCIAIAPQCSKEGSWSPSTADTQRALAIIDESIREYNIDPDRVYLTGVSSGGWGAWMIGSAYAEKFAAVMPLCGGGGDSRALANTNMPIWNFCNEGDQKSLVEANRSLESVLTMNGLSPLYTEYHKSGHDCWNQAYRNKAMLEWLLQQSRGKNKLESEKFRLIDDEVDQQNEALVSEGDELFGKGLTDSGPIACGEFPHLIEFHFHTKFTPDQTLTIRLESTESSEQLVLHLPYSPAGPATFTENSSNVFAFISPRAQNQLDPWGWNDIRVRVEQDRANVMINGFNALDETLDLADVKHWKITLVPTGPEGSDMRFRYLRWRPLTWLMTPTL